MTGVTVFGVPGEVIGLGVITGLAYGLAAVAIVIVFRATRVLNLALAQAGAMGALVLAELHSAGVAYWPALVAGLAAGALIVAVVQLVIVERLRDVPPLVTLLATLGVARVLMTLAQAIGDPTAPGVPFAAPTVLPRWSVGALAITPARTGLLIAAPLVLAGLRLFMTRTAAGRGAIAAGDDRESALGLGVDVRMTTVALCAGAGALATLTAVLTLPGGGVPTAEVLGPGLLLRALAAAAIGGFTRPAGALAGGIAVGVVEQVVLSRVDEAAVIPLLLLVIVVVALTAGPRASARRTPPGAWLLVAARPGRREARAIWTACAVVLAGALFLTVTLGATDLGTLNTVLASTIVAVSAWLTVALTGQISFAQIAIAGIGAAAGAGIAIATGSGVIGLAAGPLAGALTGGLLATAAGANRDLGPAVVSLAFAIVAFGPLLRQDWALGDGVTPAHVFHSPRPAVAMTLAGLVLALMVAAAVQRSSFGRAVLAARDNEPAAVGLGVPAARGRIQAMAVAGAVAAVGGVLLAAPVGTVRADLFPVTAGFDVLAAAVVGGLAAPGGAVVGAALVIGLPAAVGAGPGGLVASSALWLAAIVLAPRGLAGLLAFGGRARDEPPPAVRPALSQQPAGPPMALELRGVSRRFGAVQALEETSLTVGAGEAVTLAGVNGTGKTTLLDVAAGVQAPDKGKVLLDGRDVTLLGPSSPSRSGVVYLVQEGSLFPTLTVLDAVLVGAERSRRPAGLSGVAGRGATAAERGAALGALQDAGLAALAGRPVSTLSTGERRRVAFAAARAAQARLLLVDEPTAGVAEAERPRIAAQLAALAHETTLVLVDHDPQVTTAATTRKVVLGEDPIDAGGAELPRRTPGAAAGPVALQARMLSCSRGGRRIVEGAELTVRAGELVVLLGDNGAGKTTLLRALAGIDPAEGAVSLAGADVSALRAARRARLGMCSMPAGGPGFTTLTVAGALQVARSRRYLHTDKKCVSAVLDEFPELDRGRNTRVGDLSGGERQLLRIAQAVLSAPSVLLFDELSIGLAPAARVRAMTALTRLCDAGAAVVVTDQHPALATAADRVVHLEDGRLR